MGDQEKTIFSAGPWKVKRDRPYSQGFFFQLFHLLFLSFLFVGLPILIIVVAKACVEEIIPRGKRPSGSFLKRETGVTKETEPTRPNIRKVRTHGHKLYRKFQDDL